MNDQQSYLTAEKFDELKKELDHLKNHLIALNNSQGMNKKVDE